MNQTQSQLLDKWLKTITEHLKITFKIIFDKVYKPYNKLSVLLGEIHTLMCQRFRKSHILRTCCNLAVNIYSRQQLSIQGYSPKANISYQVSNVWIFPFVNDSGSFSPPLEQLTQSININIPFQRRKDANYTSVQ